MSAASECGYEMDFFAPNTSFDAINHGTKEKMSEKRFVTFAHSNIYIFL